MLIVTQNDKGRFECRREGSTGMRIVGDGASVLEAVGDWVTYSQTVEIRCEPPNVLQLFSVSNDHKDLKFNPPISRSD